MCLPSPKAPQVAPASPPPQPSPTAPQLPDDASNNPRAAATARRSLRVDLVPKVGSGLNIPM